jgi:subtilisin-like proprotein convertase family protein
VRPDVRLLLALLVAMPLFAEQRLELVRHSLTGTHCRYREYVNGIASDAFEVRPCAESGATGSQPVVAGQAESLAPQYQPLRIIDGRVARRVIVEEKPLERYAYDYDAVTGALIRVEPLFFHAKPAFVFDPNPVATLNDPSLQDRNDSADAVPQRAYRSVVLQDVVASGPLAGPYVRLVNLQAPNKQPPEASSSLVFNREDDGFEDVNVYFHIDRSQRHLQSLGYTGGRAVASYAIEADAHSANGGDNSFFFPSPTRFAEGALHFGEGGTDDAEDADLVVHEYMHAILEWISPNTFAGQFNSESRALAEGLGDYWAYSAHAEQRRASGSDPFCFADWDARCWEDDPSQQCSYTPGSDCLRRLDSDLTMADFDRGGGAGIEHQNGSIWSSALREIHDQLGREVTDTIVIESVFDAPPRPTFAVMGQRMMRADRLLFSGSHVDVICASMLSRDIVSTCDPARPRGELTLFQSSDHMLAIPENNSAGVTSQLAIADARAIERIFVRVDIAHPVRGDLRIELVAPDGTVVLLQQQSLERGPDVRTTFGLTAEPVQPLDVLHGRSAAGVWKLVVRDLLSKDAGTLLSWGLVLQLEGDEPLAARPRHETAQMIPVVAHVFGVGAAKFASDVRIANPSTQPVTATLIFTRSTGDGRASFSAIDAVLAPGQTIAFDDVVDSAFHTAGSGTLEVLGDVVVMSRTYADAGAGTLGQQVPPVGDATAMSEGPLALAPLPEEGSRYNVGIAEVAGEAGVVMAGDRRVEILPFSHVQFRGDDRFTVITVVEGRARAGAYVSQVNEHGDAMFIPAERLRSETRDLVAPAISTDRWRSDLWFRTAGGIRLFPDVLRTVIGRGPVAQLYMRTEPNELAGTRVDGGTTDQFVPLLPGRSGDQHLVFIESAPPYRTNIGVVAYSSLEIVAEVIVYDAGGTEVQRALLQTVDGVGQLPVVAGVVSGRAVVRFRAGWDGVAYASLVDGRSGDATYVQGK